MDKPRRIVVLAMIGVGAWYLVVLFTSTLRPIHDSVPTGTDARGVAIAQEVVCNALFDGADHMQRVPSADGKVFTYLRNGASLPRPASGGVYTREPCTIPHRDALRVFVMDTLVLLVALGGGGFALMKMRGHRYEPAPTPPLVSA